jgi:hypothetical protein
MHKLWIVAVTRGAHGPHEGFTENGDKILSSLSALATDDGSFFLMKMA